MSKDFVPFLPPYLNKGSQGKAVKFVQRWLKGTLGGQAPEGFIADSDYGDETEKAVITLQKNLSSYPGIPDGNFGPITRQAILKDIGFDFEAIPSENVTAITQYAGPHHEGLKPWPEAEEKVAVASAREDTDRIEVNGDSYLLPELG